MKTTRLAVGLLALGLSIGAADSSAIGPGDLKKKAEKEAKKAAEKAAGQAPAAPTAETPAGDAAEGAGAAGGAAGAGGDGGKVSQVSTKFDFVPGGDVILMDDFTRDELGEFPARWKALRGNFDVAEFEGERWLRLNGVDGLIQFKSEPLPEKWTLEFDFYQPEMTGPVFTVGGLYPGGDTWMWYCDIGGAGNQVNMSAADGVRSHATTAAPLHGRHHVSIMAQGTGVKVYVDRERMVNVAEMDYKDKPRPTAIGFRLWRYGADPMMTNVRFAKGGKEKVDMMATPFVTHGIVFDSGSDRLKPESAAVLRQVAAYLKENPEVTVTITGHTDDVGESAANQTLSEKRAAAVVASLSTDFGIDAARMAPAGKGETVPMAKNDSPEGRASNRRVEFAKS
jgi:outer membrane protein OmpA-like peptidoglycan-associated protein